MESTSASYAATLAAGVTYVTGEDALSQRAKRLARRLDARIGGARVAAVAGDDVAEVAELLPRFFSDKKANRPCLNLFAAPSPNAADEVFLLTPHTTYSG